MGLPHRPGPLSDLPHLPHLCAIITPVALALRAPTVITVEPAVPLLLALLSPNAIIPGPRALWLTHAVRSHLLAPPILLFIAELFERRRRRRVMRRINPALPVLAPLLAIHTRQIALITRVRLVLLIQLPLQQPQILRIALERRIRQIAHKRHQADGKIDGDVEQHAQLDTAIQPALDLTALLEDEQGEEDADRVADGRDDADDGFPAEADAEEVEEAHVEAVGAAAHGGEDFGVVLGDIGWDLLLDFLEFAGFAWVFDHGEVGVLYSVARQYYYSGIDGRAGDAYPAVIDLLALELAHLLLEQLVGCILAHDGRHCAC